MPSHGFVSYVLEEKFIKKKKNSRRIHEAFDIQSTKDDIQHEKKSGASINAHVLDGLQNASYSINIVATSIQTIFMIQLSHPTIPYQHRVKVWPGKSTHRVSL